MEPNTYSVRPIKSKIRKTVMTIAIVLVVVFVVVLTVIPFVVMPMFLGQRYEQKQHVSMDYGISSERITLTTDDDLELASWRTRAEDPQGTVIILSGLQNPSVTAFFGYAKMLADNG